MKRISGTIAVALVGLVVLVGMAAPAGAFGADGPPRLWKACLTGSSAGQCTVPGGIATDEATGHMFVADRPNARIDEFTIWGEFVKAWGWGVRTGAAELQTCTTTSGCLEGLEGGGVGQLERLLGVAVDSHGDVYVTNAFSYRVQKFDPDGGPGGSAKFLLTFGGKVNQTKSNEPGTSKAERNLCTAASSDTCQAGTTGTGEGEFGLWPEVGNFIAVAPNDDVYVGDVERIQRFDDEGHYLESIELPAGKKVQSLAIDRSGGVNDGDLYVTLCALDFCDPIEPKVLRLANTGPTDQQASIAVNNPRGLTVDAEGNLYVIDGERTASKELLIHKFTSAGAEAPEFPFTDGFDSSIGIATSSTCGIDGVDLYVANFNIVDSYVRAYGSPPDPTVCPPPSVPPDIQAQYPTDVDTASAVLEAQISPEFWPDASYHLEYGTSPCSSGGCTQTTPETALSTRVTNEAERVDVSLSALTPGATYHYRFVAESSGGGPVRGAGGTDALDGEEGTFTTYTAPLIARNCANESLRSQANANSATGQSFSQDLASCRAYEMVSPAEKNGGDITDGEVANSYTSPRKSSSSGERVTYSSLRPFDDPAAAPIVNQYLASRSDSGWESDPISPPRSSAFLWPPGLTGQFKGFDEDLCEGWFLQDNEVTLAEGAPPGVASIYKRNYCEAGSGYELLTPVDPPGIGPSEIKAEWYVPNFQGSSADGRHSVFRAQAQLTSNACATAGINQVYVTSEEGPLRLVSALPPSKNGVATCTNASAGTFEDSTDGFRESNMVGAISADGSRIFWTDPHDPDIESGFLGLGPGDLYLRLNATAAPSPISGGACTDPARACTVAMTSGHL